MSLRNDRQVQVSVATGRKDTNLQQKKILLSDLYGKLQTPARGIETQTEYFALKKAQQDELKDVGGFMGGTLNGGRRKAAAVTGRDIITLDFDTIPPYGTDGVIRALENMKCGYCVYSTRKHMPTAPRLRILLPLDRTVTVDEYEPIARHLASQIGIQMADPTTFEPSRLMYWPSCSADGEYIFQYKDALLVSADAVLNTYTDWHDFTSWPQVPGVNNKHKTLATKQGDPLEKPGIVGAFCRVCDEHGGIPYAMEQFLPGIYEAVDNSQDRYTYQGGSTTGGAITYDNEKFLYSHHATDPCSGKLVNAFDLVRLHKYGDLDEEVKEGTPLNRLPSYKAMCEFAAQDKETTSILLKERHDQAVKDFEGIQSAEDSDTMEWMQKLQINTQTGAVLPTIDNIKIILNNDPMLKGKFALNEFSGRGEVLGVLPWSQKNDERRLWSDTDNNGLYWYLQKAYKIKGRADIDAALDLHAKENSFNEVQQYLTGLTWDGLPRLDTLFIEYLGAEDSSYTRAVCRKSFVAAVARAMNPGCKYDNMLILCGPQGIGKSTILDKMSRGWFNDSIRTFEGKDASELLAGVWLVEVAELDAFRKTDVSRIKQFLSLRVDRYRAAYGRQVNEFKRRCVFFGTCNQMDFLQDTTGNRRFWPVEVDITPHDKKVWKDLTDDVINQIWAEAKVRWQMGEQLYLPPELESAAQEQQEAHREVSPREGLIQEFVNRQIPDDWLKWPLDRRRDYWTNNAVGDYNLVDRNRICALEVWCEVFNGTQRDMKTQDVREINAVLTKIPGWKRSKSSIYCGPYQNQRGFICQ